MRPVRSLRRKIFLLVLCTPGWAFAAGFHIPPHIQNVGPDSATLIWETTRPQDSLVRYGSAGEALESEAVGESDATLHRIRLTGLNADSHYTYRVESGEDVQEATFRTAPPGDQEMTFVVVGDPRRWEDRWAETGMAEHVKQWNADLYLTMGDLVRDGHEYAQWPEHFARFHDISKDTWFVTARGNHEGSQIRGVEDDWFAKYHELPGGEPYVYFDWGNTHFVVISYESTGRKRDWATSAQWLDEHLEGVDSQYTVVAHHYPVYCTGYYSHNLERKEPGERAEDFREVLDKHNVTLNCSGHTHIYERHYPLRDDRRDDRNGTWYVVNGGDIGANFADWWTAVVDDKPTMAKPTYTVYQCKEDRIVGRTFAYGRQERAIIEIDYFVIWQDEAIPRERLAALETSSGEARLAAIRDLGAMLYAPAAEALLPYLSHEDTAIRHAAAKSIAVLGNKMIAEELVPFLSGDDVTVATAAARSVEAAMPASLAEQVARLVVRGGRTDEARARLIGALQHHAEPEVTAETCLALLKDAGIEGIVRDRAAYALGRTASKNDVKQLLRLFEKEESRYVTLSLAVALNELTGNRNNTSNNGPIAKSKPRMRRQFVERWRQ